MNAIICLAENNYWHGVIALVNSITKHQFKGTLFVGYRNDVPNWVCQFEKTGPNQYLINKDIKIQLTLLLTKRHLGYEKVFYISDVIKNNKEISHLFYFDTDCIPIADFNYFEEWAHDHITLCSDECYTFIHRHHPWKIYWEKILTECHIDSYHLDHPYINSGYIGLGKKHFSLIEIWKSLTLYLADKGLDTTSFNKSPLQPIQGDQEILNLALCTLNENQLSIIGKEGMGFQDPVYLMVHCTSIEKPWSKNFLLSFLKTGVKISQREKVFLSYLNHPFQSLSTFKYFLKIFNIRLTSLLGRIF